jgi:hypothetical protein
MTPGTNQVLYLRMPFMLLKCSNNSLPLILSWHFQDLTQYALITDAATGSADFTGGLGAILTQMDQHGNHYAISFASRQLKDHEKNYSPFLLEAAAAVWGMEIFNEYLRGKQFILFTDHKPLEKIRTFTHKNT